jgi:hypothetical protein
MSHEMPNDLLAAFDAHVKGKDLCPGGCRGTGTIPPTFERQRAPGASTCKTCNGEGWVDRRP